MGEGRKKGVVEKEKGNELERGWRLGGWAASPWKWRIPGPFVLPMALGAGEATMADTQGPASVGLTV